MQKKIKLVVLRITNDCNLRCRYCYASGGENKEEMSWPTAKKAVDYAGRSSNSFKIQFTGGEPLLNFALIEKIIAYINERELNVQFQLQTNGVLINRQIARIIKEKEIAVGISLDGKPAINDKLRPFPDGSGSTLAVVKGLQYLKQLGIKVGMTTVLSNENITSLPELVDLASYLGNIYGISLDLLRPMGRGKKISNFPPSKESLVNKVGESLQRAEELARVGGVVVHFRELDRLQYQIEYNIKRKDYCYATTGESFCVLPNGDVYPCSSLAGLSEFYLGNILEENYSFENNYYNSFLYKKDNIIPEECNICSDKWLCGGGCLARRYAYTGSLDKIFFGDCLLKKIFIEYIRKRRIS